MTEDYKNTLLKYFTGNLQQESGSNVPQISDPISTDTTIGYQLDGYNIIDIIQGYQSSYSVIYGNDNSNKGFMAIIDENYNLVEIITEYSSGTDFGEFQVLNIDEEGKFYGIDINNGTPRFIMLNNFILKTPSQSNFIVKLRQSYNLPSPLSTASSYFAITKAVGQGKYLIGATTTDNSINSPLVTELTINVGSTNEWIDYTYTETTNSFNGNSIWASWNEDTLDFKICGYTAKTNNPYYVEYSINGSTLSKTEVMIPQPVGYNDNAYEINTILQNKNVSYIGVFGQISSGIEETVIYLYTQETGTKLLISTVGNNLGTITPNKMTQFKVLGNTTYFLYKIYVRMHSVTDLYLTTGRLTYDSATQNVNLGYKNIEARGDTQEYVFYITNYYNLYNYNILGLDFSSSTIGSKNHLLQEVYNINNYNGLPYENINSLVSNSGVLYDSNDLILFARNLYNKSIYDNTTLSVVQIPNTMINDIWINKQNLVGQTNKILVSNTDSFTKNIYETVYLNFYNTLLIQNQNTPDYIINQFASGVLNNSISNETDYISKQATKYKINYADSTNKIVNIEPTLITGEENTVSGNNVLDIDNAEESNAVLYTIDGATEQNSYSGKNLLAYPYKDTTKTNQGITFTDNGNGSLTIANTATGTAFFDFYQNASSLLVSDTTKQYTLSTYPTNNNIIFNYYERYNNTWNYKGAGSKLTFTPSSQAEGQIIRMIINNGVSMDGTYNFQLEEGADTTTYEPYVGGIPSPNPNYPQEIKTVSGDNGYLTVTVDNYDYSAQTILTFNIVGKELCQIGDYKDTLSINDSGQVVINKNIGKITLNGGETGWSYNSSSNMPFRYVIPTNIIQTSSSDEVPKLLSNYYKTYAWNNTPSYNYGMTLGSQTNVIAIRNTDITSLSNFKTWLSTHNTDVYYVLATPQTVPLSDMTIPLFDGTNHITVVCDIQTNTSITYKTPNKAVYQFNVYVNKEINSIDIISQDETTTYQTINELNTLEINKTYQIIQDCHVE